MCKEKEKVHYKDAPVEYRTDIEGWVAADGRFWGKDEHMARWASCDLMDCATEGCNEVVSKSGFTICKSCQEAKRVKKYKSLEVKVWDRKTPLYSDSFDEWFFDSDSLYDFVSELEDSSAPLDLIICEPINLRYLDDEYFLEEHHEDAELPDEVSDAINALNKAIENHGKAISWQPSKFATTVDLSE